MNKKGLIWDTATLAIAALVLIVLGVIMSIIVNSIVDAKKADFDYKQNKLDASFNTRQILMYEIKPGYYLYELIIDSVNENNYARIDQAMKSVLDYYSRESDLDQWYYGIYYQKNEFIGYYNVKSIPSNHIKLIPKVEIPNPEGRNIQVVIKRVTPIDLINYNQPDLKR